jgi:hypothetical protein
MLRTAAHRIAEQLDDAYARAVSVSSSGVLVRAEVPIAPAGTLLPLPELLVALAPPALAAHLAALRRDIST